MPQGAFNVVALLRDLGLKQISGDEMRVREDIQPTMSVGDLSDLTPPHVAPTALFGALIAGIVGQRGMIELHCLAPGGGFIEWLTWDSATMGALLRIVTVASGVAVPVPVAGQASRDAVLSTVVQGSLVATAAPSILLSQTEAFFAFAPRPIFVPRGAFFQVEGQTNGGGGSVGFSWREVPASEHVP